MSACRRDREQRSKSWHVLLYIHETDPAEKKKASASKGQMAFRGTTLAALGQMRVLQYRVQTLSVSSRYLSLRHSPHVLFHWLTYRRADGGGHVHFEPAPRAPRGRSLDSSSYVAARGRRTAGASKPHARHQCAPKAAHAGRARAGLPFPWRRKTMARHAAPGAERRQLPKPMMICICPWTPPTRGACAAAAQVK